MNPSENKDFDKLNHFIHEQLDGMKLLQEHGCFKPFLQVYYCTIDALSFVAWTGDGGAGARFMSFVKKYIIPNMADDELCGDITPVDLWGARCGLLHDNSGDNNQKDARQMSYGNKEYLMRLREECLKKHEGESRYVYFDYKIMMDAFFDGVDQLLEEMATDSEFGRAVLQRAHRCYVAVK